MKCRSPVPPAQRVAPCAPRVVRFSIVDQGVFTNWMQLTGDSMPIRSWLGSRLPVGDIKVRLPKSVAAVINAAMTDKGRAVAAGGTTTDATRGNRTDKKYTYLEAT